ncbi:hypothetical protein TL16_g10000 [Triparma laevis f. inornata]|uniref:Uncharacterized protein n=1 Tax=Triparma laevis f. inornata TaxID=1714386 RepID=A0A9W7B6F1_9STRA|nr:hypothetical protein TL16_g10000 [Triparma laevis f. inornata]
MKVFHRGFHFFFSPPLLLLLFSSHLPAAHASCTTTNSGNTDCQPIPDATIHTAVNAWVDNPVTAEASYGHIRDW